MTSSTELQLVPASAARRSGPSLAHAYGAPTRTSMRNESPCPSKHRLVFTTAPACCRRRAPSSNGPRHLPAPRDLGNRDRRSLSARPHPHAVRARRQRRWQVPHRSLHRLRHHPPTTINSWSPSPTPWAPTTSPPSATPPAKPAPCRASSERSAPGSRSRTHHGESFRETNYGITCST